MAGRGERWDRDRLVVERDREQERGRRFVEDDRIYMSGGRGRDHSDEPKFGRSYDDDMVRDRRYYEEDVRFEGRPEPRREPREPREPSYERRVVMEKERDREYYRDSSPRRPAFLRRQSSLDTHDRRPLHRFYDREEYPPPARREDVRRDDYRAPAYTPIPLPKARGLPPPQRYDDRFYEDIQVHEHERYDDYPPFQERIVEREIVKEKEKEKRDRSKESRSTRGRSRRGRSRSSKKSTRRSSSTSSSSSSSGGTTVRSEYPKKGKTRIPARLVSKRALIEIGYPFVEEGNVIVVQKALGQENIDGLLKLSEDYKKSDMEVAAARSSAGDIIRERREELIIEAPAPPQTIVIPAPPPPPPVIVEACPPNVEVVDKTVYHEVSPSRASSDWSHHHHYHHHGGEYELVERHRSRSRSKKDIRAEIRALEKELAHRPKREYGEREIIRTERLPDGQLIVYEEQVERLVPAHKPPRIEKDKKGPPPGLVRAMLATLT